MMRTPARSAPVVSVVAMEGWLSTWRPDQRPSAYPSAGLRHVPQPSMEERPSGLVQSCPPRMLGWQETSPLLGRGKTRSAMIAATPSDARRQLGVSMDTEPVQHLGRGRVTRQPAREEAQRSAS